MVALDLCETVKSTFVDVQEEIKDAFLLVEKEIYDVIDWTVGVSFLVGLGIRGIDILDKKYVLIILIIYIID